jgi:hypothetical protein
MVLMNALTVPSSRNLILPGNGAEKRRGRGIPNAKMSSNRRQLSFFSQYLLPTLMQNGSKHKIRAHFPIRRMSAFIMEPLIKSRMAAHSALRDGMQERGQREWLFPSLGA